MLVKGFAGKIIIREEVCHFIAALGSSWCQALHERPALWESAKPFIVFAVSYRGLDGVKRNTVNSVLGDRMENYIYPMVWNQGMSSGEYFPFLIGAGPFVICISSDSAIGGIASCSTALIIPSLILSTSGTRSCFPLA